MNFIRCFLTIEAVCFLHRGLVESKFLIRSARWRFGIERQVEIPKHRLRPVVNRALEHLGSLAPGVHRLPPGETRPVRAARPLKGSLEAGRAQGVASGPATNNMVYEH
jgi:hypothetical protein